MLKRILLCLGVLVTLACLPYQASAGVIEIGAGASYNKTTYYEGNYTWKRRFGGSIGYYFTPTSQIEFSFSQIFTKLHEGNDVELNDNVYSVNWVQTLGPRDMLVQPYVKAGIGQLNRSLHGFDSYGTPFVGTVDSVTGVLGAGLKIQVTRGLGLRLDGTTYLEGGKISTWQDDLDVSFGFSILF